ncbi:Curli production assembly/transport component CsgE [Pararobbsia alpina]|jgi:hypothetical protein|uniref:hypothetical protein n=1 Tax=Pararobbsia alpina TaxID=621374 RepID=UPI0039A6BF8F
MRTARRLLIGIVLASLSCASFAFDATTRLTNVPLTEQDIGGLLTRGLSKQFDTIFPEHDYGIRVIAFSRDMGNQQEAVYLSLGLSRRLPDGRYLSPHASDSTIVLQGSGLSLAQKRSNLIAALTTLTSEFDKAMLARRATVK